MKIEGEFVVFLIGMRINKLWKLHKWLPVFLAMPRMLKELEAHPESGFLGHSSAGFVVVQYWWLAADFPHFGGFEPPRATPAPLRLKAAMTTSTAHTMCHRPANLGVLMKAFMSAFHRSCYDTYTIAGCGLFAYPRRCSP